MEDMGGGSRGTGGGGATHRWAPVTKERFRGGRAARDRASPGGAGAGRSERRGGARERVPRGGGCCEK